ncbi:MAG: TetR/AcrR family transcriptional regulator [bacterium]
MNPEERRAAEKEQRRSDLLDAAEGVFAERGVDAATLADVATRAAVSRTLLYVYFRDKDDLVVAVKARALRGLRERFEAAVAGEALGLDQLVAIGRQYVAFSREQPVYFEVLERIFELAPDSPHHLECEAEGERIFGVMAQAMATGMKDGTVRSNLENPARTAMVLRATVHGVIRLYASGAPHFQAQGETLDTLVDECLDLLRRGLAR